MRITFDPDIPGDVERVRAIIAEAPESVVNRAVSPPPMPGVPSLPETPVSQVAPITAPAQVAPMPGAAPIPMPLPEPPENVVQMSDVDSKGVKYDPAIHASSRAKNADGSWRMKRGVKKVAPPKPAKPVAGFPEAVVPPPAPPAAPEPVTMEDLERKLSSLLTSGKMLNDPESAVGDAEVNSYQFVLDNLGIDRAAPADALRDDAELRAALFADCLTIEGD